MLEKNEKRKHTRLGVYHLVKYRLVSELDKGEFLTSIKDISDGGLCLRTNEKLPISSMIQLYINFPSFPKPVSSLAKVVWVNQVGKMNKYDTGIQFSDIEEALRSEIARRVESVIKKVEEQAQD